MILPHHLRQLIHCLSFVAISVTNSMIQSQREPMTLLASTKFVDPSFQINGESNITFQLWGKFESLVIIPVNLYLFTLVSMSIIPSHCFNPMIDSNIILDECVWWLHTSPRFQTAVPIPFDLEKYLLQSSFSGLVSVESMVRSTQKCPLPTSSVMNI